MPTAASTALRAAIHDALAADAALVSLLGGGKVYDEPPRAAAFPYVTLGETRIADFSVGGESSEEHQLTLHAWSRQGGHKQANPHSKRTLMTAQKGKDLLVKIADGAGYTTVAGLRTRRLAFNAETVDITHAESANRWRELLDGAGVKRASVSGRGLFKDASTDALMRQTFFDGAVKSYQIVIPDFGTVQGAFQIANLEFAGEHNGEVTYDVALESAGELTFTAL
jgi:TP901-1 family phage major tail protein